MTSSIEIVTGPAVEPLTKSEVRLHLGLSGVNDYDDRIGQLITASRKRIERTTNRRLITQNLKWYIDKFPCDDEIYLPVAPVQVVNSITYYDTNNVLQTLSTDDYTTDVITEPCRVALNWGYVWPWTRYERPNAVIIDIDAGYGDASTDVDQGIINAMLVMIEQVFDRPDDQYDKALDRIKTRELSPYFLRRF